MPISYSPEWSNTETDLVGNTLQHQAAKKGDAVACILIHTALPIDYKFLLIFFKNLNL